MRPPSEQGDLRWAQMNDDKAYEGETEQAKRFKRKHGTANDCSDNIGAPMASRVVRRRFYDYLELDAVGQCEKKFAKLDKLRSSLLSWSSTCARFERHSASRKRSPTRRCWLARVCNGMNGLVFFKRLAQHKLDGLTFGAKKTNSRAQRRAIQQSLVELQRVSI